MVDLFVGLCLLALIWKVILKVRKLRGYYAYAMLNNIC